MENKEGKEALTNYAIKFIGQTRWDLMGPNAQNELLEFAESFASLKVAESRKENYTRDQMMECWMAGKNSEYNHQIFSEWIEKIVSGELVSTEKEKEHPCCCGKDRMCNCYIK